MTWSAIVALVYEWGPVVGPVLITALILKFPALKPYAGRALALLSRLRGGSPANPSIDPQTLAEILKVLITEQEGSAGWRDHLLKEIGYRSHVPAAAAPPTPQ